MEQALANLAEIAEIQREKEEQQALAEQERQDRQTQRVWKSRINDEVKHRRAWREASKKIEKLYRPTEKNQEEKERVPVLWQIIETQMGGIYSSQPVPDVRPANEQRNQLFLDASRVLERGLSYTADQDDFSEAVNKVAVDYLGVGLGVPRVKLNSVIEEKVYTAPIYQNDPLTGAQVLVGQQEGVEEVIGDQSVEWENHPWSKFGWEPCINWKSCGWIYFQHEMLHQDIVDRFGREVKATKAQESERLSHDDWMKKRFSVYEVWDKRNKKVVFLTLSDSMPLEVIDDPFGLPEFWPCPRALMRNVPSGELRPISDYTFIEDQAYELNHLQERRAALIDQIRASGAYDNSFTELKDILSLDDGELKGIDNLASRMNAVGGVDQVLYLNEVKDKIVALSEVTAQIGLLKQQIDEALGISDIVRGVTKASESATAQEIKGRWAGIRLTPKRADVERMIRSMFRITAHLLATAVTTENLSRMTQMQITPEVAQFLQDQALVEFSIDVENESMVAKDEMKERATRKEMLDGVAFYAQSVLPMVQQNMLPASMAAAILRASLAPYAKLDRALEESLSQLPENQQQLTQLQQNMNQCQQQLQTTSQELEQWKSLALSLQNQATEAKANKDNAMANKASADAENVRVKTLNEQLEPQKTVAETGKIQAETFNIMRGNTNG